MGTLKNFLNKIKSAQYEKKFYSKLDGSHVIDNGVSFNTIKPKSSYFQIRMSEVFLRDTRVYWANYIPLVVVLTEFMHENETKAAECEAIPFLLTNNMLASVEKYVKGNHIEYRNVNIAGPLPYMGDKINLFIALYGSKASDVADNLFNCLGHVINAVNGFGLSTYINMAKDLKEGLSSLLGINGTTYQMGCMDSFIEKTGDPNEFKECYLLYVNCPEGALEGKNFYIKNHRLYSGTPKNHEPFSSHDYVLVRIDEQKHCLYESLPFHRLWKRAEQCIIQERYAEADILFRQLVQEIASSPDLTKQDRINLQLIYKADFETAIEHYSNLKVNLPDHISKKRGPITGLDPKAVFQRAASIATQAGIPEVVEDSIRGILEHWDEIPYLKERPQDFKLNSKIIAQQLDVLSNISEITDQDPIELSRAMVLEML